MSEPQPPEPQPPDPRRGDGRHLVLVGLMGAGKSTVGQRCAQRLGRPFVDVDEVIEATSGQSVAEIFRTAGDDRFRELERAAIADVCASPEPLVVACGGGAVLDVDNRRRVRETGWVVWLVATSDELAARVADTDETRSRPLLAGGEARDVLERLSTLREPAYEAAAHARVDTNGRDVDEVAELVLQELQRCAA